MASFCIDRDHLNVLRLQRPHTLPIAQLELVELASATYGFLVQRGEQLGADDFIARIRLHYHGGERQRQIEQAVLTCGDTPAHQQAGTNLFAAYPATI